MINIKLKDTVFQAPNGLFYKEGIPAKKAVLHIGTGRNDLPLGKVDMGDASNLSYRGGQTVLLIDSRGTDIDDLVLETIIHNQDYRAAYGVQLLSYVERDYIEICQDGTPLTLAQLKVYMAP